MLGKFAGNHDKFVSSSETTRETLKNIDLKFNFDFISWFRGFIEGNSSFIIKKNGYLEFKITQSSTDAQVLFYIKKNLGFGSSIQDKRNKTHHFRVRDKKGILQLILILNGNLITVNKNYKFKNWVEAYNKVYQQDIQVIFPKKQSPTFNNAWLCGFSDAVGCFMLSFDKKKVKLENQVHVSFILSQKNEFEFMYKLADLLKGKISYFSNYQGFKIIVNLSNLSNVISYFNKYSLKTKKYILYLNWLKVYNIVSNKKHLTTQGLNRVKILIYKINKKI